MNRELMDLQKGCNATCCVILDNDIDELKDKYVVDATEIPCLELLLKQHNSPAFMQYALLPSDRCFYFIIRHIDLVSESVQRDCYGLIKDRYTNLTGSMPDDYIFVLTVENRDSLKYILPELYNLCVDCI